MGRYVGPWGLGRRPSGPLTASTGKYIVPLRLGKGLEFTLQRANQAKAESGTLKRELQREATASDVNGAPEIGLPIVDHNGGTD